VLRNHLADVQIITYNRSVAPAIGTLINQPWYGRRCLDMLTALALITLAMLRTALAMLLLR
jgi:hypothetical protein